MDVRSVLDVAGAVRGRRLDLRLSQADLAARAGLSRKWLYEFEAGKPTAELGLVLRVLDALGLALELAPEADRPPAGGRIFDLDRHLDEYRSG